MALRWRWAKHLRCPSSGWGPRLGAEKAAADLILASRGMVSPATSESRAAHDVLALTLFLAEVDRSSAGLMTGDPSYTLASAHPSHACRRDIRHQSRGEIASLDIVK
jgi:hypothetical protein